MPLEGSWFGSSISTFLKPLVDCFYEHATYLFTTGRNVRTLETNTRTFAGRWKDVKEQVETVRRNNSGENNETDIWLARANKAVTDEERNRQRYEQRCMIFGWCAPNCWSNYKISKKAADILDDVEWCSKNIPKTIAKEPAPQTVETIEVPTVSLKASQVSILNQALRYIKDDEIDDTVGLVGIWGPRQVGKTLLLKTINNSFRAHCSPSASTDTRDTTNASTPDIVQEDPTNTRDPTNTSTPDIVEENPGASTGTRDPTNASTSFFSQIHKRFACPCIKKKSLTNNPSTSEIVDPTNTGASTHPRGSTSQQRGDTLDHSTSETIEEATHTGFHFVIYVTASLNCTVKNIQSEIMRRLKMQVQDGDSETTQATKISEFLKDKSFLVLLDDLRNDLDLTAVGLPHPLGVRGQLKRKVVITTRAQSVCYKMKANKEINVPGLQREEARELFVGSAGGENVYSDPNITAHVQGLVDILRVLPTELISFGRDMRGKGEPKQWDDVIHVVKDSMIPTEDQEATSLRERIIIKLKEDVKKLREESSSVRGKIELDKGNGMVATDKAKTWLARADSIISDSTAICESERTEVNWDISIAAAKLREIRECLNDRPSNTVQPPSVMPIPVHDDLQPSQLRFVESARQHIIDGPEGMMAIWGPVNVGKTLLLKMINNSFETENPLIPSSSNRGEPPFDFVIYLKATEECSVENVQSEIMQRLKMNDGNSVTPPATRIYEFFQDKSFLVLLDGLQTYLDLAAVGLPPLGIQGELKKKVVVTTRSPSLCAEMGASRIMNLLGLDSNEALQLFQQKVGCEDLYSNPRIGKHAKDIVDVLRARPSELIKFGMELRTIGDPKQREDTILKKKEYWQQSSRAELFKQAMEYIKHEPVDVIGIWGLGGVGKTHLLKKIQNQAKWLFDHVIFVTASKGCSVQNIQDQIVNNYKLEKADDVENQAKIISQFLMGKSFLLLLDDLWDRIDLGAVGIHPSEGQQKRKVVITTREMKVCGKMEVEKVINVACLPYDEAWQLFQDKVGQETLSSSPRIETLAKELVEELKGLPLALITTGWAMRGKSDPKVWENAIGYMKISCCDESDPLEMESVFIRLQYSYDSLRNDNLRKCFLTCSLWPDDWAIRMEELYECWIGLGIVDKCDIHESYREVHSIVSELEAACLLEICDYPGGSAYILHRQAPSQRPLLTKRCVKMHDMVRDMAIWISNDCGKSNDKWIVRARTGANSSRNTIPWGKVECVSLMCSRMEKLPFSSDHCYMKLKALYLNRNCLSEFIAGSETSQIFNAVTYLDLSWNKLTRISESLCGLTNLEYLNLSNNECLAEVPVSLRQLKKLKFLYLGGTVIRRIPKGIIKSLKELEVVDLITDRKTTDHEFGTDWIIRELCTLANLKAVDIAVGSQAYELLQKAPNLPIRDLVISNLREASGRCLTDGIFPSGIERMTLYQLHIKFCSVVEKVIGINMPEPFEALKVLALDNVDLEEIMWEGTTPQGLFPRLTHVDIFYCKKLQHLSWVMYLPCLQYLDVRGCKNMKQAFFSTENYGGSRASVDTFPCLIRLCFEGNPKLISLCDSDVTFPSLESLDITSCLNLKKLPFTRESLPKKLAELCVNRIFLNEIRSYGLNSTPDSTVKLTGTPGGPMVKLRLHTY